MNITKPELLAPAGNFEKLLTAFSYGADAVYVGLANFGLRKYAENFSLEQLQKGLELANKLNKKVYLVLNGYSHQQEIELLPALLEKLDISKPHGIIAADLGVATLIKKNTRIPLHISTQASVVNSETVAFWKNKGASRVVLGRECSLEQIKTIKQKTAVELEVFIHGSMCAGFSGKCIISNYTSERDANRGGCIQNCRHQYLIKNETAQAQAHLMNSKDLMSCRLIPDLIKIGVNSLKIEGRMKSKLYLANTVSVYRKIIDLAFQEQPINFNSLENQLATVSNRTFSTGFLKNTTSAALINYDFNGYTRSVDYIGSIKKVIKKELVMLEVKQTFEKTAKLEYLSFAGDWLPLPIPALKNMAGEQITKAQTSSCVLIPWFNQAQAEMVVRKKRSFNG